MTRAARTAFWLFLAAVCTIVASAFFAFPIPLIATVVILLVAVLAFFRTHDALLLFAALVPVAGAIHALSGLYYDSAALVEVFALALLIGAALRAAFHGSTIVASPFDAAAIGFAAIAAASCVAQAPSMFAWAVEPTEALVRLFRRDYFLHEAGYVGIERSALLIEGAALAALIARACRQAGKASQLSAMLVLGGTAAALLNVHRVLEVSLRNPPFLDTLWSVLLSLRLNTQFGDLNAAGSFFAMIAILAGSRAGIRSPGGWGHAIALPVLLFALWISGSRVALAATLLSLFVVFLATRYDEALSRVRLRTVLGVGIALLLLGVLVVFLLPGSRHGEFGFSVNTRVELLKVGGRMIQDRPLLGVGTGQFYVLFPRYTSDELQRAFEDANGRPIPRENAHNQFVQVGAELGMVGLLAFVLLLVASFESGLRQAGRLPELAALGGFLITALAGHPLLTPLVSWPFWLMTGLVASGGPELRLVVRRRFNAVAGALVVTLLATMPWRWSLERREADLAGVRAGFSEWLRDEGGIRFQYAGRRSRLFVSRESRLARVALRSAENQAHRVEVLLDGRPASAVTVSPEAWVELALPLPAAPDSPAYRRVDLVVADGSIGAERLLMVGRLVESAY